MRKTINIQMDHKKVIDDQDKFFGVKLSYENLGEKVEFDIGWIDKQWNQEEFKKDCEKEFNLKFDIVFIKEFSKEDYYAWKASDDFLVQ